MKRIFFILACVLAAVSCAKGDPQDVPRDYVVDWAPVTLSIIVSDAQGNDLVNPSLTDISISFQGKTYSYPDGKGQATTPHGLFVQKYQMTDRNGHLHQYRLLFGDIDGALDMDEDLILTWNDGTEYTIHYHCSEHIPGPTPRCTRKWTLNGVDTYIPILIIK